MASTIIQFRIDELDNKELTKNLKGLSANQRAKQMFIDALYSQEQTAETALKIQVATLALLQQFVAESLSERAGSVLNSARKDEADMLKNMGMSDE